MKEGSLKLRKVKEGFVFLSKYKMTIKSLFKKKSQKRRNHKTNCCRLSEFMQTPKEGN